MGTIPCMCLSHDATHAAQSYWGLMGVDLTIIYCKSWYSIEKGSLLSCTAEALAEIARCPAHVTVLYRSLAGAGKMMVQVVCRWFMEGSQWGVVKSSKQEAQDLSNSVRH